ncbi:arogenate dehydratase 2-like isoform X2 [Castanea sativa]|uniref:arogenate dehydratase 2-like isoform X2 n=1 Tax=Castanea sativa TaxID=21020 RepID=UPI003F650311
MAGARPSCRGSPMIPLTTTFPRTLITILICSQDLYLQLTLLTLFPTFELLTREFVGHTVSQRRRRRTRIAKQCLAVERWLVDRAVLPIENSLGGSIHRNYDLLLRHRLHIVGEVKFAVRHCLMANHGVKLEDLKRVLSHPQALAQCEHTLTKLGLVREAVDDTAGAAKHVAFHKLNDTGAVASSTAAMIYGLNVLAQDIQDDSDNVTRFLMLAREPIVPGTDKPFKTSIVFSLEEGPGVLFKALAVFALREINLTKIESRPLRKQLVGASDDNNNGYPKYFDYLFYVDFEASMADQNAQNALGHLREFSTYLRVLGSYPVDTCML